MDMAANETLDVIYDGECPFCSRYADMVRLRERGIAVRLHDARESSTFALFPEAARFDLDEGMLARWQGEWHHGDKAVLIISRLSRTAPLAGLMRHERLGAALYPVLRFGRNVALRIRGKGKIRAGGGR